MQTAAPSFGVELQPIDARDVGEFERVLADFAGAPNGGLIVPLSTSAETHRTRIIALADRHRLPAVYSSRVVVALGGLVSLVPIRWLTTERRRFRVMQFKKVKTPPICQCRPRPNMSW